MGGMVRDVKIFIRQLLAFFQAKRSACQSLSSRLIRSCESQTHPNSGDARRQMVEQKRTCWREAQKHTPDIIMLGRPPPYVVHYTQRFDAFTSLLRDHSLRGLLFPCFLLLSRSNLEYMSQISVNIFQPAFVERFHRRGLHRHVAATSLL